MKVFSSQILFILLFVFCFNSNSYSAHIVGGNISYEYLGINTTTGDARYKIIMYVFRDAFSGGAAFDNPAIIGIFKGNSTTIFRRIELSSPNISTIPINITNPCWVVPSNIGVQQAAYQGIVELPFEASGYWISYQRCCRNSTINNLNNPSSEGATYTIFLSALAQQQQNSSPNFNAFPPIIVCQNRPLVFDHAATDLNGNTLAYEFCSPFHGGDNSDPAPDPPSAPPYLPVQFGFGFSAANPMTSNPALSIDPTTGLLTGFPTAQGQYVVGVCVKEYDAAGNLLSTTLRDFQFNVVPCNDQVDAKIAADSIDFVNEQYYVQSCGDSVVTFDNTSSIQSFITAYEWRIDLGNGNIFTSSDFEPTVAFPGNGVYQGWLVANPGSMGCTDTALLSISISLDVQADFRMSYEPCEIGRVEFENLTTFNSNAPITKYTWTFGDGNSSNALNPKHQYFYPNDTGQHTVTLRAEDITGCVSTATKTLDWTPMPIFPLILEDSRACVPVDASSFISTHYPISGYRFAWDFGDGNSSNQTFGEHSYTQSGIYNRSLRITSPKGCTQTFSSTHTALDTPRAAFSYTPEKLTSFAPDVQFIDDSDLASMWEWDFGDGNTKLSSFDGDINHTYADTGLQIVQLIVHHQNGCTDTARQVLDVVPQYTFFLPNALTPNGDGTNDVYMGKGHIRYMNHFDMSIYNRWGECIFQTNDSLEAWNGRKNNVGEKCQAGVYAVLVRIEGPRGEKQEVKGYATIVY